MAIDVNKAHEVSDGLLVYERVGGNTTEGPFITGGPYIPIGLNLPEKTYYIQTKDDGILVWRKFGNDVLDWVVDNITIRDYIDYDCYIPKNNSMIFKNTSFDKSILIDGEGFVL